MNNTKTKSRSGTARIIRLAILGTIVYTLAITGVFFLKKDAVVNLNFKIIFVAIPLILTALFAFLFFVKLKPVAETVIVSVTAGVCMLFVSFEVFLGVFEFLDHSWTGWPIMPPVLCESDPVDTEYYNYNSYFGLIFHSESHVLIYKYDDEEYVETKAQLDEEYVFETHARKSCGEVCEPTDELDGFYLRMLDTGKYPGSHLEYPKRLVLIGTNDETREIMYIAFYDFDIDYLTSLSHFVNVDCGWKYIR